jgi:hypothetical protein
MGRLFLGLVLTAAMLVATGPSKATAGRATADAVATHEAKGRDACGPKTKKPNGKPWRCTFADHFDGPKLDRHWVQHPEKVPLGRGASCKKRKNVRVWNKQLQLTVSRTGSALGCQFHVGSVTTYRTFSQKYGRFQARIKAIGTRERGLQEAFWLWPDDRYNKEKNYPASGEIDISETYSQFPDLAVPYLHYRKARGDRSPQTAQDCKAERGKWHVYTLLWGPDRIEIKVDGKTCLVNTSGNRAFDKRYIICLSALSGVGPNGVSSKTPLPSTMRVDWVKVWR